MISNVGHYEYKRMLNYDRWGVVLEMACVIPFPWRARRKHNSDRVEDEQYIIIINYYNTLAGMFEKSWQFSLTSPSSQTRHDYTCKQCLSVANRMRQIGAKLLKYIALHLIMLLIHSLKKNHYFKIVFVNIFYYNIISIGIILNLLNIVIYPLQ